MASPSVAPARRPARAMAVYILVAVGLVVGYAVTATLLWINRDFADDGPLGLHAPAAIAALDGGTSLATVEQRCREVGNFSGNRKYSTKVVAARVDGTAYYACYQLDGARVLYAAVVDAQGVAAPDRVVKKAGAWPWLGVVKTPTELVGGGIALAAFLLLYLLYYRRPRPGPPVPARWWQTSAVNGLLGALLVLPLTLPFRRRESRARRMRLLYLYVFGLSTAIVAVVFLGGVGDRLSAVTVGWLLAGLAYGWLGGRTLLRPPGFGVSDAADRPQTAWAGGTAPVPVPGGVVAGTAPVPAGAPVAVERARGTGGGEGVADVATVRRPDTLPTFADVGGMDALKTELADTFGMLLAFSGEADTYRITFNGILLHGPPGVGKTFVARATAGEFGLNLVHVSAADLSSKFVGESARNVRAVFEQAARNVPCLLFFDEFDSVAESRDEGTGEESRRTVNQLLQSLEEWRGVRELVIMAATNHLDRLDPAVTRPGRFDRRIRVDLPDLQARRAILAAQLAGRPVADDVDLDGLARRTEGRTPAVIARVVEAAALAAFRAATTSGASTPITGAHLDAALAGLGGSDRPTVEGWSWDRLVLDEGVKAELRQVQAVVADPDRARRYGVEPPSGLLLAGPPGTGKTTIARVFAAEGGFSFYPVTAADLTSKWVGESEANVARLFARARDNAPSIIFVDEIDAVAAARSESGTSYEDRILTQLLAEIDGMTQQRGVFVMAATNRPELLDPALLRGGRMSRTITIPLPDRPARRRLLDVFCRSMPLGDVDLDWVAARTGGMSGADLEALCQQAALLSMAAEEGAGSGATPVVTRAAFAEALRARSGRTGSAADAAGVGGGERPPDASGGYL